MKKLKRLLAVWALLFASAPLQADVAVLVHGYLGSAASWEESGVNAVLMANGWKRAGILRTDPYGVELIPVVGDEGDNSLYQVELPSLAPMMVQADQLQAMLQQVAELHPDEPIALVAHSAGGVVARIVLVRGGVPHAKALITIASPHLGTGRAVQALESTDIPYPFCLVQNFFTGGKTRLLRESRGALVDLVPAQPGSLLFWLNSQPHPHIAYHSIVRPGPVGLGDELVPAFSQDMNRIPALQGQSDVTVVSAPHSLNVQDGVVLAQLLKE
ncbi:esterase/lipase family protein [Sedimenticola sp.]|uniref:esterase/lipase family protein n=1 Tax=Sedimenticola sp. TaxID=1940285 RepID=UPI003D13493C